MEQTYIFDRATVATLKILDANVTQHVEETWKESLARWKQFSPETRDAIEQQVLIPGEENPLPVVLTIRLEIFSLIDEKSLTNILQTKLTRLEIIKDPIPYSKFTVVETGEVYLYRGIYTPPSPFYSSSASYFPDSLPPPFDTI